FHDLDRMTGGFKDSDLIIVAGRPAMGKGLKDDSIIINYSTGEPMTIEQAVKDEIRRVHGFTSDGRIKPLDVAAWVDSGVKAWFKLTTRTGRSGIGRHHVR